MNTSASQKIKIGIFTAAGILVLLLGIFIIGKKKNLFGDTFHIYGTFNNVGGLQVGNNIQFAGINIGTVEDITILSDTVIRVDMVLQSKIKPFLKTNSFAHIGSDGLMGDKLITIVPGENDLLLPNGGRIFTVNPINLENSITKLTKVADNAEVISAQLAGITIQIGQGKGSMGRLLYHDDLAKALEGTVSNAESITASLANITSEIKSGKGSLGRLLYNDSLSRTLELTATNAKQTMSTINDAAFGFSENMKALSNNFLFRGYFKKKAKEKAAADGKVVDAKDAKVEDTTDDLTDAELAEIDAAAEKAHQAIVDRKKKTTKN